MKKKIFLMPIKGSAEKMINFACAGCKAWKSIPLPADWHPGGTVLCPECGTPNREPATRYVSSVTKKEAV